MSKDIDNSINHQAFEPASVKVDDTMSEIEKQNNNEDKEEIPEIKIATLEKEIKLIRQRILIKFYGIIAIFLTLPISVFFFFYNINNAIKGFTFTSPPGACPSRGICNYPVPYTGNMFAISLTAPILLASLLGLIGLIWTIITDQSEIVDIKTDIDILQVRRKVTMQFPEISIGQEEASYFDMLVRINIENLRLYYKLVRSHTEKSFFASIFAGITGFILIITGLIVGFINPTYYHNLSYITTGAGVITEFISGVFFYLYNRTVRQLKEYHDSLLTVQNILLSFKIVEDTKDDKEKVKMISQILSNLVGKQPPIKGQ
jgi:hypothetical protein